MKICKWLLCVAMALTLTAGSALAVEGAKPEKKKNRARKARPKKARSGLRGEYRIMASEAKLTEEQQKKIGEIIKTQAADRKAKNAQAAPIKKELAAARKAKDKAKAKELQTKLKGLRVDRKTQQAAIMAVLTDEQKSAWASFSVYRSACRKFGRAKLTADQKKAIREMCSKEKPTGDRKADNAALKALTAKISSDVLTDEQRTAMKPKPKVKKDKPARIKKPRKKKKDANQ